MSSRSTFSGRTCVATTISLEHSQEYFLKLFIGQVGLHGYNNFNLICETDEGLLYSSTETFDGLMPYLQKYNNNGWINTDGLKFDKYIKRVYKKYLNDYPDRPAYLIYVSGKSRRGFKGENKIMGITDIDAIKKAGREFLAGMLAPEHFNELDSESRARVFRSLLGLR